MDTKTKITIHVNHNHHEMGHVQVTGAQIKALAAIPEANLLFREVHGPGDCAIVTASRCSIAENSVTLSFSSVHAPRITLPSSAISHSPSTSFLACAKSHAQVIRSSPAASIPVSTFLIVCMLGYEYLNLNQSHLAPSFLCSGRGMSAAWLAISR